MPFPASKIWAAIEDWLIPSLRLNTHERALYYHLVRRTRLDGRRTVRISRSILARVSGLSPCIARHYLRSLAQKQCILILDRRPQGCLVEVRLPSQIRRALARLPQAAAAHLLWAPDQPERTAAGHPRAWPRPHPLVAPDFRASILHRNFGVRRLAAALDATRSAGHSRSLRKQQSQPRGSRHAPNPRVPRPRDSRGWVSAPRRAPRPSYRRHPAGSSAARQRGPGVRRLAAALPSAKLASRRQRRPSSAPRDRRRRLASDLARKDKVATRPNLSTFRPFNLSTFDPSTFRHSIKPRCFYCHTPLRPRQWALDHIVPRTLGGSDSPSNLVAACHSCNSQKAASPADLFLRSLFLRRIISRSHLHLRLKSLRSLLATRH